MSDFDEEAERERLREQFERDKQKREASERMSELLLKGATMTNAHCDTCSDPIFRYEGQEFCPTCQRPVGNAGDATESEEGAARDTTPGEAADTGRDTPSPRDAPSPQDASADPATDAASSDDGTDAPAEPADGRAEAAPERPAEPSRTDHGERGAGGRRADAGETGPEPSSDATPSRQPAPTAEETPGEGDDLAAATASLERTLARLSRAAEGADDLARQREYLQAAREAAEALEAARRAR